LFTIETRYDGTIEPVVSLAVAVLSTRAATINPLIELIDYADDRLIEYSSINRNKFTFA